MPLCNLIHSAEQQVACPESLLQNPVAFMKNNNKMYRQFGESCEAIAEDQSIDTNSFIEHMIAKTQKIELSNPFFLIRECINEHCAHTRSKEPFFRSEFENDASILLQQQIDAAPNAPIKYTSLSTEHGLPELIVVTKALVAKPNTRIKVCLINNNYENAIQARLNCGHSHTITLQDKDKFLLFIHTYMKSINSTENKEAIVKNLFDLLCTELQHQQFMHWFTHYFPHAHLSLHIYQSVEQYFKHDKNVQPADVVTSLHTVSDRNAYDNLCAKTLLLNPKACNLALNVYASGLFDKQMLLYRFRLNRTKNSEEYLRCYNSATQETTIIHRENQLLALFQY